MHRLLPLLALLLATPLAAEHITDRLQVPLYSEPGKQKPALRQVPGGTPVEVLETREKYVKVRLGDDDTQGWVEKELIGKEKPLKAQIVELQARNGELQKELEQARSAPAKPAECPPSAPPVPEVAECMARLDAARGEIDMLTRQISHQSSPSPQLAAENRQLRERIEQASILLGAPLPEQGGVPETVSGLNSLHLIAAGLIALFGFVAGVLFRNYRLRRRYGGMRL